MIVRPGTLITSTAAGGEGGAISTPVTELADDDGTTFLEDDDGLTYLTDD